MSSVRLREPKGSRSTLKTEDMIKHHYELARKYVLEEFLWSVARCHGTTSGAVMYLSGRQGDAAVTNNPPSLGPKSTKVYFSFGLPPRWVASGNQGIQGYSPMSVTSCKICKACSNSRLIVENIKDVFSSCTDRSLEKQWYLKK